MTTTEPTTTPAPFLSPADYARALHHLRKLESARLMQTIRATTEPAQCAVTVTTTPDHEVTIEVEETIEETTTPDPLPEPDPEQHNLTHPERITTPPAEAITLTPPPAPKEPRHWSPVPSPLHRNLDTDWSPEPEPRELPPVDRYNAASVKAWAEARWPEHPNVGAHRLQVLEAETILASVSAVARNTPYGQKLVHDRTRKRLRNQQATGNADTQRKARATGAAGRASGGLMVGRVAL